MTPPIRGLRVSARLGPVLALVVAACSTPGGDSKTIQGHVVEPLRESGHPRPGMGEEEKIQALLDATRRSGMTFLRNGRPHDGDKAAKHLERKLEQAGDGVRTARAFIETVASRSAMTRKPYMVELPDGRSMTAQAWYTERLAQIEADERKRLGDAAAHGTKTAASEAPRAPTADAQPSLKHRTIPRIIRMIDESDHTFLVPQRKGPPKVMTGAEFASMLESKWQWLGRDIKDVDAFLEEIAGSAFSSMKPYRVRVSETEELELRPWVERELRRHTAASAATAPAPNPPAAAPGAAP